MFLTPGCAVLPAAAPTAAEVEANVSYAADGIEIFDLNAEVISALANLRSTGFAQRFSSKAPPADLRLSVGDALQVSVIEESPGLFTSASQAGGIVGSTGGGQSLLPVTIGRDGMISFPYAGRIRAAGLTIEAVREELERKLAEKAINPQVQVALAGGASAGANNATVSGEVGHAGIITLRPSGSRMLDVIAEAGGARFPAFESTVHLTRGKLEAAVSLGDIVKSPPENIYVYPGDEIYVSHEPKTFSVLGASTKDARYEFGSKSLNLAEAVAQGGGFVDAESDPSGVFVFRYEQPALVRALRPDVAVPDASDVPVVYRVNLRDASGYFRARQFAIRDKDIVLLSNADGAQWLKALNLLQGAAGTAVAINSILLPTSSGGVSTVVGTTAVAH